MAAVKKAKRQPKKATTEKPKAKKKPAGLKITEKSSSEKVAAENPRGKQGVNIAPEKYDLIRQNILSYIWRNEEVAFTKLLEDLEIKLAPSFEGSVSWYVTWVKMDLETKGIIEQVPDKKPQHLRLKQRLEQPED
jgi:hypothetical protein